MTSWDKYAGKASGWTEHEYARPEAYLSHRAELIHTLGPALHAGDVVLDLACADGGLADFLPEQRYVGVDASEEMVVAGRECGRELVHADLNDYEPPQPVQVTTIFRAIYYASDRRKLFERIAGYTERKLVFDLNPRQYRLEEVRADLRAAGLDQVETRPFFVPQTHAAPLLTVFEYSPLLARLLLRYRFTLLCAASRRVGAS
jgi:trans-aconitate methyltransferase